jgi:hypothetical protein
MRHLFGFCVGLTLTLSGCATTAEEAGRTNGSHLDDPARPH